MLNSPRIQHHVGMLEPLPFKKTRIWISKIAKPTNKFFVSFSPNVWGNDHRHEERENGGGEGTSGKQEIASHNAHK
jgi:hypothetical protein